VRLVRTRARICQFKQNALFLFFEQLAIETGDFQQIFIGPECTMVAAVSDEPFGIQPGGRFSPSPAHRVKAEQKRLESQSADSA
jgi:hypothetical protein